MNDDESWEDLLRRLAPQVLAAVTRRHGNFEAAEDAVQEALLAAATQWPEQGIPDRPTAWLITVASRRLTDQLRSERASRHREERLFARIPPDQLTAPAADTDRRDADDTLILLLLCCHPSLTPPSQVALMLRAVGGLTTAEIARAFLTPEKTMAQRISRARQRVRESGAEFRMPPPEELPERLGVVLHALYLIFNEGYIATSGPSLHRVDLTAEAIRLTRMIRQVLPHDGEVAGLLALMLLTDARRTARTGADGSLIPLAEQDRGRWQREPLAEGLALITATLSRQRLGPFQLQAAIAAVHSEAADPKDTDWPQILELYNLLADMAPSPMAALGHAVAAAMVSGPRAGLDLLAPIESELPEQHRLHAVRAHLLEMTGDRRAAIESYRRAARLTTSIPEQHYLLERADRLLPDDR